MSNLIYLPFMNGWRLAMGLKPLQLQDWVEIGTDYAEQLRLKQDLLTQRYSEVFVQLPGSEAAQREVLDLLVTHLLRYFPQHYQRQGTVLYNGLTDQYWNLAELTISPLDLAGRLVQEDLCLMLPADPQYMLAAASVCFPSRWSLQEKLGQPIAQIHHFVPGYTENLERPVNHFFDRLKPDYPGYRLNWGIVDSPDLFLDQRQRQPGADPTISLENVGERLWLRVERQTLRRLPVSNGILFTIRTYIHPLNQLMDDPEIVHQLRNALQQIPTAMQIYKNLLPIRSVLLSYLEYTENQLVDSVSADPVSSD